MGTLEARRVKFKKDQKKKVTKSYIDFQKFLEESYFQFELLKQSTPEDLTEKKFLEFVRTFRKEFKINQSTKDLKLWPAIAINLYKMEK